jgi:L-aspartate oxidase
MQLGALGPECVDELLVSGVKVPFDRDDNGQLSLCLEASHNRARIIHWKDQTGLAITKNMQQFIATNSQITSLQSRTVVDLVKNQTGRCIGARVFNSQTNLEEIFLATNTILASGGLGEIFRHTSNHPSARGDGYAIAHRVGAQLSSMEFVQFHPTTFYIPGDRSFLLTEALRGEGARLMNNDGHYFAKDYHELGELAPRDVVSRMIMSELHRSGDEHVWLDISHRDAAWLQHRFPAIYQHCLNKGYDLTKTALPVVPAAHYFCGGVDVDLKGRTTVPGLYAAGEVSCTGLHGGNRLASTSLLEGLVWGREIARDILSSPSSSVESFAGDIAQLSSMFRPSVSLTSSAQRRLALHWTTLQDTMWTHVGIKRSSHGLSAAASILSDIQRDLAELSQGSGLNLEWLGLSNAVSTAQLITSAAQENKVSQGAHYVIDELPNAVPTAVPKRPVKVANPITIPVIPEQSSPNAIHIRP